jgi:hypothetical protein
LVSYQAQTLITAPFPPLGLLSSSYFGLSSYLILIGLYSSAAKYSEYVRKYSICGWGICGCLPRS